MVPVEVPVLVQHDTAHDGELSNLRWMTGLQQVLEDLDGVVALQDRLLVDNRGQEISLQVVACRSIEVVEHDHGVPVREAGGTPPVLHDAEDAVSLTSGRLSARVQKRDG